MITHFVALFRNIRMRWGKKAWHHETRIQSICLVTRVLNDRVASPGLGLTTVRTRPRGESYLCPLRTRKEAVRLGG